MRERASHRAADVVLVAFNQKVGTRRGSARKFYDAYFDTLGMSYQMFNYLLRRGFVMSRHVANFYRACREARIPVPPLSEIDPLLELRAHCGPGRKEP